MRRLSTRPRPAAPARWHSPRYAVECELGRGGMGVVYRAYDRLARRHVAVKRIEREEDYVGEPQAVSNVHPRRLPSLATRLDRSRTQPAARRLSDHDHQRLALAQEFRILASLRHPSIISVLDYGFDELGRSYLVMELVENARTLVDAYELYSLQQRIALLCQLMQALRYLHRCGVLHRDLKPENVLLAQVDGVPTVKVVDFGLAVWAHQHDPQSELAGTVAYMAPEVLQGALPGVASDLYALGVVCYELCGGRHPHEHLERPIDFIRAARSGTADLSVLPLPEPARQLVAALMAAKPQQRPPDIAEAYARWCTATGLQAPIESLEIRDSFLRSARFVGREQERICLSRALDEAVEGRGSAWLVSGMSGVGKSRLIDEVKAAALVRGMLVLRGDAIDGGAQSFAIWRGILRELALYVPLSALEIAVLNGLVDDLGEVLGQPIESLASLDRDGNLRRLAKVIEAAFRRLDVPVLVVLEDLHWATHESAALLRRVLAGVSSRRAIVIGTVRSDERPLWLAELAVFQELTLEPFDASHVSALCEAVLGSATANVDTVAAIRQASGGTPFFILEALRTLAEEHGTLDDVARDQHAERPSLVPSKLLERRLGLVPPGAHALLEVAAVAGRQIDVPMLAQIEADVAGWLAKCTAVSVLEVVDDRWRFAHDKLREQLLAQLPAARRRQLHARVADALQQAHGARTPAAVMAYHRRAAGQAARAFPHLLVAAEEALQHGALTQAQAFAQDALDLAREVPITLLDKARARLVMVETAYARSRRDQMVMHTRALLAEVGLKGLHGASSRIGLLAGLLLAPRRNPLSIDSADLGLDVWIVVLKAITIAFHAEVLGGHVEEALQLLALAYNLSRSVGQHAHNAACTSAIAYFLSLTPLRQLAPKLLDHASRVIEAQDASGSRAGLYEARGLVCIHLGRWLEATRHFRMLEEFSLAIGDDRNAVFGILQDCLACEARGQLGSARARLDDVRQHVSNDDDYQLRGLVLNRRGWISLHLGHLAQAREAFETALVFETIHLVKLAQSGGLAMALWLLEEDELAERRALDALTLLRSRRQGGHAGIFAVPAIARVLLACYHAGPTAERKAAAERALESARQYGKQLPVGWPAYLLMAARHARWQGQIQQARQRAAQSIEAAHQLSMPLDHALAVIELADMSSGDAGARRRAAAARRDLRNRGAMGWLQISQGRKRAAL